MGWGGGGYLVCGKWNINYLKEKHDAEIRLHCHKAGSNFALIFKIISEKKMSLKILRF